MIGAFALSAINGCAKFEGNVENKVGFFRNGEYALAIMLDNKTFYFSNPQESMSIDPKIPYGGNYSFNAGDFTMVNPEKLKKIILKRGELDSIISFSPINSTYHPSLNDFINQDTKFYVERFTEY